MAKWISERDQAAEPLKPVQPLLVAMMTWANYVETLVDGEPAQKIILLRHGRAGNLTILHSLQSQQSHKTFSKIYAFIMSLQKRCLFKKVIYTKKMCFQKKMFCYVDSNNILRNVRSKMV